MRAVVVFDSMFGNTHRVAEARTGSARPRGSISWRSSTRRARRRVSGGAGRRGVTGCRGPRETDQHDDDALGEQQQPDAAEDQADRREPSGAIVRGRVRNHEGRAARRDTEAQDNQKRSDDDHDDSSGTRRLLTPITTPGT